MSPKGESATPSWKCWAEAEKRDFISTSHPGIMSNQGLIKKAGKYWVVFLEEITLIDFTKMFPALAICNTWVLAYTQLEEECSVGVRVKQEGSHQHVQNRTLSLGILQMFQARLRLLSLHPSIAGNQRQLSGKALKSWSLWSILYVCLGLTSFMGPFLILSGSHYRKQGR